ncbi:MAG TPA: FAD-dependent oxidoreductase [Candidatus Glassbacteria bacterium]|nr:FAD-dependent oxidoreductase [Candidatus Glassbacteria bacterium]
MSKKIVIIGAHAAGVDAASACRKKDRTAEIILITKEKHAGYSRCGLPFVIGGQIPNFEDLIVFSPAFYKMLKLNLKTETTVIEINRTNKNVSVIDKNGISEILEYDKLIISTGASPFLPRIKGYEKKGIMSLRTLEDGIQIDQNVKEGAKTALIMGAGLIGLETGIGLHERGLKVTIVEMLPQILPAMLDMDMANQVKETLVQKGLSILTEKRVEEILGEEKANGVIAGGEQINADILVSAFGVRANTKLAEDAKIAIGETKAIKTNQRMETNDADIFAAGDCAEVPNLITHQPSCSQLGTIAVRQGKVAGTNAGGGYALFEGVLASAVTKLYDTEIGSTGLTTTAAKRAKIETVSGKISSKTRADYFPGAKPIKVKLVVEKESHRIVGSQIIGGEEVTQRINALSFAIQKNMTVNELAKADTAYAPPLCETWEPIVLAAEIALRKLG